MRRGELPTFEIERLDNGFVCNMFDGDEEGDWNTSVYQEDENDELKAIEEVLWSIVEFFGKMGSRYDKERIHICRKRGDKFEKPRKEKVE